MKHAQKKEVIRKLKAKKVEFEHGLSDQEIQEIELKFDIQFPPDLRDFVQTELPISDNFVNWRLGLHSKDEEAYIRHRIDWPFGSMVFDIEHNIFWMEGWGEKSEDINKNIMVAEIYYETYPKMIPIFSHRYIPSKPYKAGNPIFSIYQTDIIYYGYDLAHYFAHEFRFELSDKFPTIDEPRYIEFWSDIES